MPTKKCQKKKKQTALSLRSASRTHAYAYVTHTVLIRYGYFARNEFFSSDFFNPCFTSTNQLCSYVAHTLLMLFFLSFILHLNKNQAFFWLYVRELSSFFRQSPTNQLALSAPFTHALRMLYSYFFLKRIKKQLALCPRTVFVFDEIQSVQWDLLVGFAGVFFRLLSFFSSFVFFFLPPRFITKRHLFCCCDLTDNRSDYI